MRSLPVRSSARRNVSLRISAAFCAFAILASGSAKGADQAAAAVESTFRQYCFQCHGEAATMAGISLVQLTAEPSFGESFDQWQKVAAALDDKRMPPQGLPQPSDAERSRAAAWVRASLRDFAELHAGDPGRVTVRRLTSAEYGYTIRDLTGLSLNLDRAFAGDAVGGEGFTNFGDVQFMNDASLESYLEAAKTVADHAVIGAGPLEFFDDPGKSGFELSAIHRIHDIYRKHGFRAVAAEGGRAFGLERYGKAFFVAWQYLHREKLGQARLSLEELAARENLSPRFVQHIWSTLEKPSPSYPTSEVVSRWRSLPAPEGPQADTAAVRAECEEIQRFVINWPRWLFGAGELAAGGAGDERALVITDASLQAQTKERLRFFERIRERGQAPVHLSVAPTNPGSKADAVVIWRNATVRVGRDSPGRPLREFLDNETAAKLRFGQSPDGSAVGRNDFWTASGESFTFNLAVPDDARFAGLDVEVELVPEQGSDAVLRLLISESAEESGRPAWALLADSDSRGFREWKADVLEYAASFPQTSHGEPTPSDRDPIPPPFDNTYNQPERDRFHFRVKYYRDDRFLVEKMLDDAPRRRLDDAWSDLMASFEYHDAFLDFVEDKYELDLGGKAIGDLSAADIARLPAEPRPYVEALCSEYLAVLAAQKAAQPGHVEDAIRFASRAWRRPLSADEEQDLRSFYEQAKADLGLDHEQGIRALLTRILVAPPFLYRLEEPAEIAGAAPLSDWEMASRLSYFLWSSGPDQTLREAAQAGKLGDPAELERQVERMLSAPKTRRLATEFFGQWLGFYRFDRYRGVDAKRFPEFTDEVKAAMYDEAVSLFEHVIGKDRPIREIFTADYTFLNQALAKHYGIEKEIASTDGVELVSGANAFERGGLLRLGAILTATSAPLRTSPVKRGDWMLRRILGTPTPPPPPDAGSIPADDQLFGGLTVRERLEAHKRNPTCASCHTRIDPLGFPFEHFDPLGRWREAYPDGKPIDDSAALADKTEIDGVKGLLGYLDREQEQVLRNMSHKLLGYALGRTVLASDQPLIERLAEAGGDVTFRELATQIVLSPQFRYRRGLEDSQYSKDEAPSTPAAVGGSAE